MKYDLISDVHYDHNLKVFPNLVEMKNPGSDILVIAGDIANNDKLAVNFISMVSEIYDHVIFVDGNHDHYFNNKRYRSIPERMNELESLSSSFDNVHYLNDGTKVVKFDDVAFVGACGWYDFNIDNFSRDQMIDAWTKFSNDANRKTINMHRWSPDYWPDKLAEVQAKNMANTVRILQDDNDVKRIVIVTHTVPHERGLIWSDANLAWNLLNGAYHNSNMKLVYAADKKHKIIHSVFGHTHSYNSFMVDDIWFVSNPLGYSKSEQDHFENWKMLQMNTSDVPGKFISAFGDVEE